jgi:hypothetical protein
MLGQMGIKHVLQKISPLQNQLAFLKIVLLNQQVKVPRQCRLLLFDVFDVFDVCDVCDVCDV